MPSARDSKEVGHRGGANRWVVLRDAGIIEVRILELIEEKKRKKEKLRNG